MKVHIAAVAKQLPKYWKDTPEILNLVDQWLHGQESRFVKKAKKIFEAASVDRRYSIMEPLEVFTATSFAQKNAIYARECIALGEMALRNALSKTNWTPQSIDFIITVSCTGIMIPSLDAYLINRLNMRGDIVRLPVTEMGCAAGISGMIYAEQFLRANPGKRAAVIAVESPTATFQLGDLSMANIVSAAIFGDGAACVLMSSETEASGPAVRDSQMYHFFDKEHLMGFDLTDSGLKMILDESVPETIGAHFNDIIEPFLKRNNLEISGLDHLIFHPGGKKIIQTVETLFEGLGKNIDATKSVLRQYGNMSSATVLYVLEEIMNQQPQSGETGLMLSFGPGFSAQRILIEW